ncbi:MAG: hypothetical protein WCJ30_11270, partial [Deltaproteobacteria bacterium]
HLPADSIEQFRAVSAGMHVVRVDSTWVVLVDPADPNRPAEYITMQSLWSLQACLEFVQAA